MIEEKKSKIKVAEVKEVVEKHQKADFYAQI